MPVAWRLTKTKHLANAWDGAGARLAGGRWNSAGTPVVYASATLSLALVETLVHVASGILPAYTAIPFEFDAALVTRLEPRTLPPDWKANPAPGSTRAIGEAWVDQARSVLLQVPSVVVPLESNFLINPKHRDFGRISIGKPMPFPFDPRLPLP